jgi:FkbM family methyltransferase
MLKHYFFSKFYFWVTRLFLYLGYFKGSTRLINVVSTLTPIVTGRFRHPLGFTWDIQSRDAFRTYLSSCEPFTTKLVTLLGGDAQSFICVGANRGWYPLALGAKSKVLQIFAFECNTLIFDSLLQNITSNSNQSQLFEFAIGDKEAHEPIYMPTGGNEGMSTLYPQEDVSSNLGLIEFVNVQTLDASLAQHLDTLGETLILMDIEGGEFKALLGAKKIMNLWNPVVILELNPKMLRAADSSAEDILSYFEKLQYSVFWIDEREKLVKVENPHNLPHLNHLPENTGANYLFLPAKRNLKTIQDYFAHSEMS